MRYYLHSNIEEYSRLCYLSLLRYKLRKNMKLEFFSCMLCSFLLACGSDNKGDMRNHDDDQTSKHTQPVSLEVLKPFQVCMADSDCVFTNNGCCDCANGGIEVAVAKNRLEDFKKIFACDNIACTEKARIPACGTGSIQCVNALCQFKPN